MSYKSGIPTSSAPFWLVNPQSGQGYPITPAGVRIGRDPGNQVVLPDAEVSHHHALVWSQGGSCYVQDQGSTNGTWVNGQLVRQPTALRPGDQVRLGRTILVVQTTHKPYAQTRGARRPSSPFPASQGQQALLIGGLLVLGIVILGVALTLSADSPSQPGAGSEVITRQPTPAAPAVAMCSQGATREQGLMAAVQIAVPVMRGSRVEDASLGSGSIVSPDGYILTNYHLFADKTGRLYNQEGLSLIAVNVTSPDQPPEFMYRARLIDHDRALDLALLRIFADADGNPLPASLRLPAIPIGDSDRVHIGDTLSVIGFPGTGGETVTLTQGIVSGFLDDDTLSKGWIKTDTEISRGNSGGLALDQAGCLVGVPTAGLVDPQLSGKLGYVRPINLARGILRSVGK
ncbi:MAG: trypsin-like peptidase domain-containing protein [Anaerolineae bacterium]|nr:trypsin-like peptidase domain-containing protein [Anaerolineae bacterium]